MFDEKKSMSNLRNLQCMALFYIHLRSNSDFFFGLIKSGKVNGMALTRMCKSDFWNSNFRFHSSQTFLMMQVSICGYFRRQAFRTYLKFKVVLKGELGAK